MEIEPEIPKHDKTPNLKLVMNPEGKVHDWTDLPEEELPELQNIATGGLNQEASRQMLENLQACKGRGKMREPPKKHQPLNMSLTPVRPSMNEQITENKQSIVGVFGGVTKGGPVQNGKTFPSSHDGLKVALFELNYNSIKSCLSAMVMGKIRVLGVFAHLIQVKEITLPNDTGKICNKVYIL